MPNSLSFKPGAGQSALAAFEHEPAQYQAQVNEILLKRLSSDTEFASYVSDILNSAELSRLHAKPLVRIGKIDSSTEVVHGDKTTITITAAGDVNWNGRK